MHINSLLLMHLGFFLFIHPLFAQYSYQKLTKIRCIFNFDLMWHKPNAHFHFDKLIIMSLFFFFSSSFFQIVSCGNFRHIVFIKRNAHTENRIHKQIWTFIETCTHWGLNRSIGHWMLVSKWRRSFGSSGCCILWKMVSCTQYRFRKSASILNLLTWSNCKGRLRYCIFSHVNQLQ